VHELLACAVQCQRYGDIAIFHDQPPDPDNPEPNSFENRKIKSRDPPNLEVSTAHGKIIYEPFDDGWTQAKNAVAV